MSKITSINAREILDSRGHPTLWVKVTLDKEFSGIAQVPSGASRGSNEAFEKRDMDQRYMGKGVLQAVKIVKDVIFPALADEVVNCTADVDQVLLSLDKDKSTLGGNSTIGVSIAVAHALANASGKKLYQEFSNGEEDFFMPVPFVNVINGGCHARNPLMIQEFMIVPSGFSSFKEAIRCACEVFHVLGNLCSAGGVGDEGGYAPDLKTPERVLDLLLSSVEKAGYTAGKQVHFALDVAGSELFRDGKYEIDSDRILNSNDLISLYKDLSRNYPIVSIEDPFDQDDIDGWKQITKEMKSQLVGDDIFCTQKKLLKRGIEDVCANAILIKPNQVGTVTETLETIEFAKASNYRTMISHRSGETGDTTISDLAIGTKALQIKAGSVCRFERVAKYNRILQIEEDLGKNAHYAGEVLKWN